MDEDTLTWILLLISLAVSGVTVALVIRTFSYIRRIEAAVTRIEKANELYEYLRLRDRREF